MKHEQWLIILDLTNSMQKLCCTHVYTIIITMQKLCYIYACVYYVYMYHVPIEHCGLLDNGTYTRSIHMRITKFLHSVYVPKKTQCSIGTCMVPITHYAHIVYTCMRITKFLHIVYSYIAGTLYSSIFTNSK